MKDTDKRITVKQAANLLGRCDQTIYSWIYKGWINAINPAKKQTKRQRALWRIPLSEIEAQIGLPICPKTLKPITSPTICIHCKRDCPRASNPEGK